MRLTTKPGVSAQATGVLPQARAVSYARVAAAGSVADPETTSTSGSSGAGLKKCRPTKRPGTRSAPPTAVTDREEVLVASRQASPTTSSRARNSSCLTSSRSTTASTTSAHPARSARLPAGASRERAASRSAPVMRFFSTSRSSRAPIASAASRARPATASYSRTGWPATSATWAMPWPMVPVPTTATGLLRSSAVMCAILPHGVFHRCGGPPCPDRSFGYSSRVRLFLPRFPPGPRTRRRGVGPAWPPNSPLTS